MKTIEQIASAADRSLTTKGNLELGSHDAGTYSPPGGQISYQMVTYYLLKTGDFRVVIDDRHGSNQGYFQENGGEKISMDGPTLEDVIELARDHCADADGDNLTKLTTAWRIASAEARSTMRASEKDTRDLRDILADMMEYWSEGTPIHPGSEIVAELRKVLG